MSGLFAQPNQNTVGTNSVGGNFLHRVGFIGFIAALLSILATAATAQPLLLNARVALLEAVDPFGVAVDAAGNVFVADTNNHRVLKVATNGAITSVAGTGESGFSGDGAKATLARLSNPYGIALDARGNLYIADRNNNRIRKVTATGIISTVAGNGQAGFSGDNAAATGASLSFPYAVAVSATDEVFVSDYFNHRVRRVSRDGIISTYAGTGVFGFSGDNGIATNAQLGSPAGLAISVDGTLYVSDALNHRVRCVSPNGIISTVAGTGIAGFVGDGAFANRAKLDNPRGVGVDVKGNLYIADAGNGRVRRVALDGTISTVAGSGQSGFSGDGGLADGAALNFPIGLAIDMFGNLFISDSKNRRVRSVNSAGMIATVAGSGVPSVVDDNRRVGLVAVASMAKSGTSMPTSTRLLLASGTGMRFRP
jgi:trimeric autotransporter adhesin